ncbi:hypothetical protein HJC23_008914 [Cyclotella cryptica]|uniref:Ankyrin n=1 Tax=Cyclotella cryptica TaxID=29204 RepID=A0ABD3Q2X7_9STRA|eukprot:CCRYP_009589-RB/>CCRYP_009589-RB protein AED:0.11 eAED:0.11 QI:109/-1/1/1/-1/1/1/546/269
MTNITILRGIILTSLFYFATPTCFIAVTYRWSKHGQRLLSVPSSSNYLDSLTRSVLRRENNRIINLSNLPPTDKNDPYAPGIAEAYGLTSPPTSQHGFDPSADTVGPSIYGGSVHRDASGAVLYSHLAHDHHKPGPLYDGRGYSLMARAIHAGKDKVAALLRDFPQLVEEVGTGGARPLHVCGMSVRGQDSVRTLVEAGADVHALDSYNYNALHRMASNDLEIGAQILVEAGLDPNGVVEGADSTPIEIARRQRSIKFLMMMQKLGHYE